MKELFKLARLAVLAAALPALAAESLPQVVVHKDPNCGCCGAWVEHMRTNGFQVKVVETGNLEAVKRRFGVPDQLASCHTAEVAGYVMEGHVPAVAIKRLLKEKPAVRGLAVPGMPQGSPGMEVPSGKKDPYDVVSFDRSGRAKVYESYR